MHHSGNLHSSRRVAPTTSNSNNSNNKKNHLMRKSTCSTAPETSTTKSHDIKDLATQFMERFFCCSTAATSPNLHVSDGTLDYCMPSSAELGGCSTYSNNNNNKKSPEARYPEDNSLMGSVHSQQSHNPHEEGATTLDLASRSTGDCTLPRPHGFIFLDNSNNATTTSAAPTLSAWAVLRRHGSRETATTVSSSSGDDHSYPSHIPSIPSSQTFDEDEDDWQDDDDHHARPASQAPTELAHNKRVVGALPSLCALRASRDSPQRLSRKRFDTASVRPKPQSFRC